MELGLLEEMRLNVAAREMEKLSVFTEKQLSKELRGRERAAVRVSPSPNQ
jgi:hypothetical protein